MVTSEWIEARMNTIILGDCLEIMKQVPDKYFDLVLTDIDNRCKYRYNLQS